MKKEGLVIEKKGKTARRKKNKGKEELTARVVGGKGKPITLGLWGTDLQLEIPN